MEVEERHVSPDVDLESEDVMKHAPGRHRPQHLGQSVTFVLKSEGPFKGVARLLT